MNFEACDRVPLWEFGYWGGTIRRWQKEGLPSENELAESIGYGDSIAGPGAYWGSPPLSAPRDRDVADFFNFDKELQNVPLENWIFPPYEERVLRDEGDTILSVDKQGVTMRKRKDGSSRPEFLAWPVSNIDDWEQLKVEKFQVRIEDRLPQNWLDLLREFRNRDYPLSIGGAPCGFFGSLRYLLGEVRLFTAYYDNPQLIRKILDFLTDFWIALFSEVLSQVKVDSCEIWEDMCYKNGSLISPAIFKEFMSPCYKKLTGFLKSKGVDVIIVDTDGNCWELIPLFIESGVTGIYPMEVQANMDIVQVRKKYSELQIFGGLDKNKLALGKEEIDKELRAKLSFMLKGSGYIPYADHLIPPNVSWENFKYYREKLRIMVETYKTQVNR